MSISTSTNYGENGHSTANPTITTTDPKETQPINYIEYHYHLFSVTSKWAVYSFRRLTNYMDFHTIERVHGWMRSGRGSYKQKTRHIVVYGGPLCILSCYIGYCLSRLVSLLSGLEGIKVVLCLGHCVSSVGFLDPCLGGVSSSLQVELGVVLEDTSLLRVLLVGSLLLLGFSITDLLVLSKS
jgi:hypothetical protein